MLPCFISSWTCFRSILYNTSYWKIDRYWNRFSL